MYLRYWAFMSLKTLSGLYLQAYLLLSPFCLFIHKKKVTAIILIYWYWIWTLKGCGKGPLLNPAGVRNWVQGTAESFTTALDRCQLWHMPMSLFTEGDRSTKIDPPNPNEVLMKFHRETSHWETVAMWGSYRSFALTSIQIACASLS